MKTAGLGCSHKSCLKKYKFVCFGCPHHRKSYSRLSIVKNSNTKDRDLLSNSHIIFKLPGQHRHQLNTINIITLVFVITVSSDPTLLPHCSFNHRKFYGFLLNIELLYLILFSTSFILNLSI